MLLAEGKNGFLDFRGSNSNFELNTEILKPAEYMKDLEVFICHDLTRNKHINEKLKKAVQTLYFVKRNTSFETNSLSKLCLYVYDTSDHYIRFALSTSEQAISGQN